MFCCVRTRGRKERDFDDHRAAKEANAKIRGSKPSPPPPPPAVSSGYGEKSREAGGNGLKDGNMVVLGGAGAVVGATAATAVVVGVGDNDAGESQGCCFSAGAGGCAGCGCVGGGCGGGGCGG